MLSNLRIIAKSPVHFKALTKNFVQLIEPIFYQVVSRIVQSDEADMEKVSIYDNCGIIYLQYRNQPSSCNQGYRRSIHRYT